MTERPPDSHETLPPTVAVVRCEDYEAERVFDAVGRGLALLGGPQAFAKVGDQILLKPNLLAGSAPGKAVTTHPSVFSAVARNFQAVGARLSYGDSPGFGRSESAARHAKLVEAAEALGIPMADFGSGKTVSFPEGRLVKQFTIAAGVLEADGIVSLPKLKTHALTRMTGAVKNQFGCIPGLLKGEFHARMPELERFAQMLVDLTRLLRPRLYVMDAIVAMEGNGPRGGKPRPLSALLFSADPVALDAVACTMIGLDPDLVPTIRWGESFGLGTAGPIRLLGETPEIFLVRDFVVNREPTPIAASLPGLPAWLLRRYVVARPAIEAARCTRCGTCVKVCPATPKALDFRKGAKQPPVYDYNLCIRCYCCQELCPEHAIAVQRPRLGNLLLKPRAAHAQE